MIALELPKKLKKALQKEADDAHLSLNAHILKKLEGITPPVEYIDKSILKKGLPKLVDYLNRIPSVSVMSCKVTKDAFWWIKLEIDICNDYSWHAVQELGFVLNHISIAEPMPTIFKPVSPPPYMNGGPEEFLSWIIESTFNYIDPNWVKETLESRLPNPVDNLEEWGKQ